MDELKLLSDDVIEQIKDFKFWNLTEEQKSLIDKLISNEELKECYKNYGLCENCKQLKTVDVWCQSCNSKQFQQNFKNWTSGNHEVDEFIQKVQLKAKHNYQILEWIEYDRLENIEYLAKGGFGTVFKAIWKDGPILSFDYDNNQPKREVETKVALKCLHNSQDIIVDFLKEIEAHNLSHDGDGWIVKCFGITKDPETENFLMVMKLKESSLRQHLNNNFISLNWVQKFSSLYGIAKGLKGIHNSGLIHRDFHCGNILNDLDNNAFITDLGLCQSTNVKSSQNSNKKIYGVLPYVAPEVLRGKEYTQASDIYGFGIIAYEICTGLPPYHDVAHDEFLAMKICQGLRPKTNYRIPQLLLDIINQCWDANPLRRLKVDELYDSLKNLFDYMNDTFNPAIDKQIKEVDKINEDSSYLSTFSPLLSTGTLSYMTHPQAIYTSKLLDFKNLPEPKNINNNDDLLGSEYSESIRIDFTKLNINSKDENH